MATTHCEIIWKVVFVATRRNELVFCRHRRSLQRCIARG